MKKLAFIIAFAMIGTSGVIANTSNDIVEDEMFACTTVNTSCGITGIACGNTLGDLLEAAADLEKWMCGPQQ